MDTTFIKLTAEIENAAGRRWPAGTVFEVRCNPNGIDWIVAHGDATGLGIQAECAEVAKIAELPMGDRFRLARDFVRRTQAPTRRLEVNELTTQEKIDVIREAQEKLNEAIELLAPLAQEDSWAKGYVYAHLVTLAGDGHGYLTHDPSLDTWIRSLQERDRAEDLENDGEEFVLQYHRDQGLARD